MVKNQPAKAGDARHMCSIPGLGSCPGVWIGNPLQYSCLENCKDRRAWWATVNGLQRVRHNWGTEQACNTLLKWVSCGQYIGKSYFLSPVNLYLLTGEFVLDLNWLLIWKDLLLPSCYLYAICHVFFIPSFLWSCLLLCLIFFSSVLF